MKQFEGVLRDYQQKSVQETLKWIEKGKTNICIQQPTGAGKSIIIAYLTALFRSQGKKILFVAHKVELLEQMYNHIHRWLEFMPCYFNKHGYHPNYDVVITSIQAWSYAHGRNKHSYLPKADVVIVDECHHVASNSYSDLFSFYESSIKLGFTATPKRLDNKGLRWLNYGVKGFEVLVKGVHVAELMERNYLTPYKVFVPDSVLQIEGSDARQIMKKDGSDYNEKLLESFVREHINPSEVVEAYLQYGYGKKNVLYPVSVATAYQYSKAFNEAGISSAVIEAKTPEKQRKQILQDFREGKIKVLSQHSIIIEGVDVPDIEVVQIVRPTKSLVVWWQSIGRSLRPAPNKEYAIIIDHTTNHRELKMPDIPVRFSLDPESYDGEKTHLECMAWATIGKKRCNHRWLPSADRELKNFEEYGSYEEEREDGKIWLIREGILNNIHCRKCNQVDSYQWTIEECQSESEQGERVIKIEVPQETGEIDINKPSEKYQKIIDDMLGFAKSMGRKPSWIAVRIQQLHNDLQYNDFVYLGRKLGYKPSWASYQYEEYDNNRRQLQIHFKEVA